MDTRTFMTEGNYTKRKLHKELPISENSHCLKNPFFKEKPLLTQRKKSHDLKCSEGKNNDFVIRCKSGYKSALKKKSIEFVQVAKPAQILDASVVSIWSLEDPKSSLPESKCSFKFSTSGEMSNSLLSLSSFKEDAIDLKACMEYKKQVSPELINQFSLLRYLPKVSKTELERKQILYRQFICTSKILEKIQTQEGKIIALILNILKKLLKKMIESDFIKSHRPKLSDKSLFIELSSILIRSFSSNPSPRLPNLQPWVEVVYYSEMQKKQVSSYICVRPFAEKFLSELAPLFEIIIFTTEEMAFVQAVMSHVLNSFSSCVDHILARDKCVSKGDYLIKDLRVVLNRQLDKCVILDSSLLSFSSQLDNGMLVPSFKGNSDDRELLELIKFLKANAGVKDITEEIKKLLLLSSLYRIFTIEE